MSFKLKGNKQLYFLLQNKHTILNWFILLVTQRKANFIPKHPELVIIGQPTSECGIFVENRKEDPFLSSTVNLLF